VLLGDQATLSRKRPSPPGQAGVQDPSTSKL
jgi:hypothetical protein